MWWPIIVNLILSLINWLVWYLDDKRKATVFNLWASGVLFGMILVMIIDMLMR